MSSSGIQALANQWAADLESWALPQEILDQAPEVPWKHPVAMFTVAPPHTPIPDSLSHQRAREVLEPGGSVLDIGSGGGRASMAITPPAGTLTAVDHQQEMLDEFHKAAETRGAIAHSYLGDWPDVAATSFLKLMLWCAITLLTTWPTSFRSCKLSMLMRASVWSWRFP